MKTSFLHTYGSLLLAVLIGTALGAAFGYYGQCTSGTCPFTSTWWRGALYGGVIGTILGASSISRHRSSRQSERPPAIKPAIPRDAKPPEHSAPKED